MTSAADESTLKSAAAEIRWDPASRVASVLYTPGAALMTADGAFLVDALTRWIGTDGTPFAVLANAKGLRGTDGPYRSHVGKFFRGHRHTAFIALTNVGPVIHVVVEMFRIGTGIQLKTFSDEGAARSWLRSKGIAV